MTFVSEILIVIESCFMVSPLTTSLTADLRDSLRDVRNMYLLITDRFGCPEYYAMGNGREVHSTCYMAEDSRRTGGSGVPGVQAYQGSRRTGAPGVPGRALKTRCSVDRALWEFGYN